MSNTLSQIGTKVGTEFKAHRLRIEALEDANDVITETVQDIVGGMVSGNTENGIAVTYDDTTGKLNLDVNDPVITLAGDVTGSATMTNLGNVTITTTVAANSVALGTDTTGNYVADVTAGSYVLKSGTVGEGWSPTIAVDAASTNTASKVVARDASGNFAAGTITATLSGNSSTATKLQTARTINGVSFDGSANITINAVDSTARVASSLLGVANGVATLDASGKVPSSQLPSFVDDVLEYTNLASFPATGETGKIYVDLTTNKTYRWSGSAYVYITSGAVDSVAGKTGIVTLTKSDVGLGNVTNVAQLPNTQTLAITGDATASATALNTGTIAVTLATVADSGTGSFLKLAKNTKGLVTGTTAVTQSDITGLLGAGSITNTMLANTAVANLSGTNTGDETATTIKTKLGITTLSGSNTGDQTITLTGDVTGSGTGSFAATLSNTGVTAGTYGSATAITPITVDAKGRVTGTGSAITITPAFSSITGKPTTLSGYGITDAINVSQKGVANGVATLDATGKVPSTQLPSYVDDVVEATNLAGFPATGETGKIYVALDTNKAYRWSGSAYVYITSGAVDSVAGKTGVVTLVKGDVGLGSVDNTADSTKNVLSATKLTTARTIGGVSFDGTANISLPGVDTTGNQSTTGNAATATKLATARTISLSGDATGSISFDGSGNVTIPVVIADDSHNHAKLAGNPHIVRDLNALIQTTVQSGELHYHAYTAGSNGGVGMTDNANGVITVGQHSGGYNSQISFSSDGHLYWRESIAGGTPTAWQKIWKDGSDGADSGLDADLLDGQQGSYYQPASTAITTANIGSQSVNYATSSGSTTGNAATATKLATARTISLSGDVTGSASFDGSANISIAATVAANSVALGTDTTGNYVAGATAGQGITITGTAGEGWSPTIGLAALDLTLFPTSNFKKSVKSATTANITLSATQTIDGISVVAGDRVLVKDQTTASQNGIYIVNASTWTRSVAADGSDEIDSAVVAVDQGTVNGGKFFTNTFKTTDVVGTTAMNWFEVATTSSNVASATKLATARTITLAGDQTGSVSFDGSANVTLTTANVPANLLANLKTVDGSGSGLDADLLDGMNAASTNTASTVVSRDASGNFAAGTITAALAGNASTATKLATARTINGVSFDGSANITINAVDSTARIAATEKGTANGVATLGADGKVPSTQLPSYVDDVLEFTNLASFPATGESGKIYVALDTNKTYRWSGSAYVYITSGAVDSVAGKTGVVTLVKADVGLSNVDNTSDANKPVSTATQTALNAKQNTITGAATTITSSNLTASMAMVTDASGKVAAHGTVSATELGYLDGVTSAIQTQLNGKASSTHSHVISDVTNLQTTLDGKASTSVATTSVNGLMSAADKTKLDGVATGANNYAHPTGDGNLHVPATGTTNAGKVLTAGSTAGSLSWTTIPAAPVSSVAGRTGAITLTKTDVGLGNVDNTADSAKAVLSATKLATARTIGGVSFDGTANINLPGVNTAGNQNTTGNAATVTNGVYTTGDQTIAGVKTFSSSPVVPTATTATQAINSNSIFGFKNHIINGNFDVWQRDVSQTTGGYGSDDRWANNNIGSTKTHSRVACTDTERVLFNASSFSRTVVTSVAGAGNYVNKAQYIEDVTKLAGKTVTLSFWAKANSNKNIAVEFLQIFGTGGSPSATVPIIGSQLVSLTTTWQKKTVTVTLPSIVGKTLGTDGVHTTSTALVFWFDSGSDINVSTANLGQQSGTFDIAQVQLEEGSVATPFEQRPYGLELSLCQRYYEKTFEDIVIPADNLGTGSAPKCSRGVLGFGTNSYFGYQFKVPKRVKPTIKLYNPSSSVSNQVTIFKSATRYDSTSITVEQLTESNVEYVAVNASVTDGAVIFHLTASAEL